jgi:hypothetical protein
MEMTDTIQMSSGYRYTPAQLVEWGALMQELKDLMEQGHVIGIEAKEAAWHLFGAWESMAWFDHNTRTARFLVNQAKGRRDRPAALESRGADTSNCLNSTGETK